MPMCQSYRMQSESLFLIRPVNLQRSSNVEQWTDAKTTCSRCWRAAKKHSINGAFATDDRSIMPKDADYPEILKKLRADPNAIHWSKRQELANSLTRTFESKKGDGTALALVYLLAGDSKWEVRKGIGNVLSSLPEDAQVKLIAQMSADSNAFVRRAVDRAVEIRRQKRQTSTKQT